MIAARILIVEDESILALDIEDVVTSFGYEVIGIAMNAEEALSLIAQTPPDLILMDVRIQGEVDGIKTANQIWEQFRLPTVFLTASAEDVTIQRIQAMHGFGYVLKPFEMKKLETAIAAALLQYQAEMVG